MVILTYASLFSPKSFWRDFKQFPPFDSPLSCMRGMGCRGITWDGQAGCQILNFTTYLTLGIYPFQIQINKPTYVIHTD